MNELQYRVLRINLAVALSGALFGLAGFLVALLK